MFEGVTAVPVVCNVFAGCPPRIHARRSFRSRLRHTAAGHTPSPSLPPGWRLCQPRGHCQVVAPAAHWHPSRAHCFLICFLRPQLAAVVSASFPPKVASRWHLPPLRLPVSRFPSRRKPIYLYTEYRCHHNTNGGIYSGTLVEKGLYPSKIDLHATREK